MDWSIFDKLKEKYEDGEGVIAYNVYKSDFSLDSQQDLENSLRERFESITPEITFEWIFEYSFNHAEGKLGGVVLHGIPNERFTEDLTEGVEFDDVYHTEVHLASMDLFERKLNVCWDQNSWDVWDAGADKKDLLDLVIFLEDIGLKYDSRRTLVTDISIAYNLNSREEE